MARMTVRRKGAIAIAATLAAAALAAGAGAGLHYWSDVRATCMNRGATVVTKGSDGECAGITDGTYHFAGADAALNAVLGQMARENQLVTRPGSDYVSVAYLLPIAAGGVESIHTITEQLQGAYTEQMYANRNSVNGSTPLIQILIASSGEQGTDWPAVVPDIERAVTSQHLVAVAGLGVSLDTTTAAVLALTRAGIPVVGSTISSDDYDNIKGLFRVSPSNGDLVDAALAYIRPKVHAAIVITDTNPADSYDVTLVQEFSPGFGDTTRPVNDTLSYNTNPVSGESVPAALAIADNEIEQMAGTICAARGSVVLFAGRGRELGVLLSGLASMCENQPVTIVTGDDVINMTLAPKIDLALRHVTLYFAGNANPGEWQAGRCPAIASGRTAFRRFDQAFQSFVRPPPAAAAAMIADGEAMMGYDAMLTTISAIRLASATVPTTTAVLGQLGLLQGAHAVPGASGFIALSADYATKDGSNPVSKAIPVLQYHPYGSVTFKKLYWSQPPGGELAEASQTRACS